MAKKVHIILQGKGGVGKSFIAIMLAMYYQHNGIAYQGFDTDPVNSTFAGFKGLDVEYFNVSNTNNEIEPALFDGLFEKVIENCQDKDAIIDVGSNGFMNLCSYLITTDLFTILTEAGFEVYIHSSIVGGQNLLDTLNGFDSICTSFPKDVEFVVWQNPFWGPVEVDGRKLDDFKSYKRHQNRVAAMIEIPVFGSSLNTKDLTDMLTSRLTFTEIQTGQYPQFKIFALQRLKNVQKTFFEKIDASQLINNSNATAE